MSEEACQIVCDADAQCNFFFWSIEKLCAMFKTCDGLRKGEQPGTIYAKNGQCSGIIDFSASSNFSIHQNTISKQQIFEKINLVFFRQNKGKMATNEML